MHEDVYNGKVWCQDGEAAWVVPRLHRGSGWAVEIRRGDPDGPIVERGWYPHRAAAHAAVQELRARLARSSIDEIATGSVLAPMRRGIVVVHGIRFSRGPVPFGAIDGGPPVQLCSALWAEPGRRTVRWLWQGTLLQEGEWRDAAALEVDVVAGEVHHVAQLPRHLNRPRDHGARPPFGHWTWRW